MVMVVHSSEKFIKGCGMNWIEMALNAATYFVATVFKFSLRYFMARY